MAALAAYGGTATCVTYTGGLVLRDDGWVAWGCAPEDAIPVMEEAAQHAVTPPARSEPLLVKVAFDTNGREYRAGVESARASIAEGDVYVLNLTAQLSGGLAFPLSETFAALRDRTHSDMSAYLSGWPGRVASLASASPERFLKIDIWPDGRRTVAVSPIKGTSARGASPEEDEASAAALLNDPKERAEHVMVVDLERNDIGVACEPGTVVVDPLYEIVTTPYCHQLVSTVRGTLRKDARFAELLAATFPCGSVTGAPKSAAMRIIAGLERSSRQAYCGSLLVSVPGELDSSVLIRTVEVPSAGLGAVWGAGCGITYDSDAASEWLETLLKASPVLGDALPPVALRETMCLVRGRTPLLARHLARLAEGGCGAGVLARVRSETARLAECAAGDARALRLGVTVTPDGSVQASVTDAPSSLDVDGGIRYAIVEIAEAPELPPAAAKPAARRFWDLAHRKAVNRGAHQAVLATPDGVLIDGSTATVWICREGRLLTPPAPPAIAGVARETVFDLAAALGIEAAEVRLTVENLESADEVFFTNAYGGVALAAERGGPVGAAIAAAFEETLSGGS